jgi:hypothetical protein
MFSESDVVRSDPFLDEVAVDFPSIGAVLDRVRDAFLSEGAAPRADTLKVAVHISGAQAYRGTVASIAVPVRFTCATCGGRGESWADPCLSCCGTGYSDEHSVLRVPVPPGVVDGARLYFRVRPPHGSAIRVEVTVVLNEARLRFEDLST